MKFSLRSAREFDRNGDYGSAVAHYMAILKMAPSTIDELESEFLSTFEKFVNSAEKSASNNPNNDLNEIHDYFILIDEFYSKSQRFLILWGEFMSRRTLLEEAADRFAKALEFEATTSMDGLRGFRDEGAIRKSLRNIRHGLIDRWHFRMLNDRSRNAAYEEALTACLADRARTVLDLGSGTGILSMLAVESGASKVYACESSSVMHRMAEKIVKANGYRHGQIELINKHSRDLDLSQDFNGKRVDLIVTEIMDSGFYGEGIVDTILDARTRLLRNDGNGLVIPGKARIWACAIEAEAIRRSNSISSEPMVQRSDQQQRVEASDSSSSSRRTDQPATNDIDRATVDQTDRQPSWSLPPRSWMVMKKLKDGYRYLTRPIIIDEIDLNSDHDLRQHKIGVQRTLETEIVSSGYVDAIACWFDADLLPSNIDRSNGKSIEISTSPENSQIAWEQAIFPVPFDGRRRTVGEKVTIQATIQDDLMHVTIGDKSIDQSPLSSIVGPIVDSSTRHPSEQQIDIEDQSIIEVINDDHLFGFFDRYLNALPSGSRILDLTGNPRLIAGAFEKYRVYSVQSAESRPIAEFFIDRSCRQSEKSTVNGGPVIGSSVEALEEKIESRRRQTGDGRSMDGESGGEHTVAQSEIDGSAIDKSAPDDQTDQLDLLLFSPVESSGLLKSNALEDLAYCRLRFSPSRIAPASIHIYGRLIESRELISYTRVIDDDVTLGLKIAPTINVCETDVQRDLELSTLDYRALSEPIILISMDFTEDDIDRSSSAASGDRLPKFLKQSTRLTTESIDDGTVHGMLFWYEMDFGNAGRFSTTDHENHYRSSAAVFDQFSVDRGDLIIVETSLDRSELYFRVKLFDLADL